MSNLSEDQRRELKEAFELFDKDRNGVIDKNELRAVLVSLGLETTDVELMDMFRQVDLNGDMEISFEEFAKLMQEKLTDTSLEDEAREAFSVFDRDGDGFISAKELQVVMKNLGESLTKSQVKEMIAEVDKDKDGRISFEEFKDMILTQDLQV